MTVGPTRPDAGHHGIEVVRGDITAERVDAIVNSADASLMGGRGVDGAIHAAAGPDLLEACLEVRSTLLLDGLRPGEAVATSAGDLPCRYVIHALGPDRRVGQTDPDLLAAAFRASLDVAAELGCASVAVPAIGAGVFGWDPDAVAHIAMGTVVTHARDGIDVVRFVLYSDDAHAAFARALEEMTA